MMQAEAFELNGDDVEATVHVIDVGEAFGGPEALGDGGCSRPDARVDGALIELLAPHGDFAAEDKLSLFGVERRVGGQRIGEVMYACGLHATEIVRGGENDLVS